VTFLRALPMRKSGVINGPLAPPASNAPEMTVNGPMTRSGRVATLEEAKAQFQKSWDVWTAWAKLEETD
jgi:hypothetical protein